MWNELPEWEFDAERDGIYGGDWRSLTARTAVHPSPAGRQWFASYGRGDDWYDPDTNLFHFFGGQAPECSIAFYEGHAMEEYAAEFLKSRGRTRNNPHR